MLVLLLMLVLAVNGGLFTGALLFSALEAARFGQLVDMAEKMWHLAS